MQQVNSRSNNRANTMISQSFIASEFQGFNDPFINTMPTSALNQLGRSKPISNSGFFQQNQNQQSFGFNNISPSGVISIQKQSRPTQQSIRVGNPSTQTIQSTTSNVSNNAYQQQLYSNQNMPQVVVQNNVQYQPIVNVHQQSQYQQRPSMNMLPPQQQQFLNQNNQYQDRYVSPMIVKVDSPTKRPSSNFGQIPQQHQQQQLSQFNQQQSQQQRQSFSSQQQQQQVPPPQQVPQPQPQQQIPVSNQQPLISNQQKRAVTAAYQQVFQNHQQTQNISKKNPQTSSSKVTSMPIKQSIKQSSFAQLQSMTLQKSQQIQKSLSNPSLLLQSSNSNLNKTTALASSQSSSMKRLKLNVSQQFSNSFTLKCVKQPQRSNIIEMKKRQRQFRKSIQNFFI